MFGDHTENANFIDDSTISNILIRGRSPARMRLYQMGIASAWEEINERYDILGKCNNNWIPFKKGVNYEAFLVFRKIAQSHA
jgi:hypothetical protein